MKILHVFNRHRGGGGADNAWDATIAISRRKGLDIACFERSSKDLGDGIGGKLSALGNSLYAPAAMREFRQRLQTERPDIVHTHEFYPLISPWVLELCAQMGVPVAHSCYDFRITCPVATHYDGQNVCTRCHDKGAHHALLGNCRGNRLESAAFALRHAVAGWRDFYRLHVDQFIALTDFSADWMHDRLGIARERLSVNECAVPASPFPVDPVQGQYIAYAGRFVPEKGMDVLLEAARIANIPIHLAGPAGSDPAPFLAQGHPVTITSNPDELARVYRGARALVAPSVWFETFVLVAAESLAHGVPVIASRIGALRDTVRENVTGLHFEPGNAADLARQMRRLWDDPALCRALGAEGHGDVVARFSEDAHFDRMMTAYDRAISHRARRN